MEAQLCACVQFDRHFKKSCTREVQVEGIKTLLASCRQGHSTALVLSLVARVTDNMICFQRGCLFPDRRLHIKSTILSDARRSRRRTV